MMIVIDEAIPFIKGTLEPFAEIKYMAGREIDNRSLREADALITRTRTRCDAELLAGSSVKFIATATIGYDHIDMAYCNKNGIMVSNAAGCNSRAVLQWVGAALSLLSESEGWRPGEKTIGVVGVGNVGSLIADYCRHWGFNVLCCDPPRKNRAETGTGEFVEFDIIARECDIVSFHTPLIKAGKYATFHLADEDFFHTLRSGAIIINSSRGEVVDTQPLLKAVTEKKIIPVIDTWENEPDINRDLLREARIATTHIAGYSIQGKANATAAAVDSIAGFYSFPLRSWFPPGIKPATPHHIYWEKLKETIVPYCDLRAETLRLKGNPEKFENIRKNYHLREEYF